MTKLTVSSQSRIKLKCFLMIQRIQTVIIRINVVC